MSAAVTIAASTSIRTLTVTAWNTVLRTARGSSWTAAAYRAAKNRIIASLTARRARLSYRAAATAVRPPPRSKDSARRKDRIWESKTPAGEESPYRNEWNDLVGAILDNKPYNEVHRGVQASLVTSMGRRAAHTGRTVTLEELLASDHAFAANADKLTMDGPAPLLADANGRYPVPQPGIVTSREY